jgi:hypothetical protein
MFPKKGMIVPLEVTIGLNKNIPSKYINQLLKILPYPKDDFWKGWDTHG